jgi:DNA repair exonuclease SbcCD nuclease subunit
MKVLFTADIHIKYGQKNVPVDWAKNRFQLLWEQLENLQKDCDIFVVGGDTFDRLPNMEELEEYFNFVEHCKVPTYIIPGNHEALKKNTTFLSYLKKSTSRVNKLVEIIDECCTKHGIDFVPYNKLKDFDPKSFQSSILVTHVRGEIPPHVKPEINLDQFDRWEVVLAGDLHSYDNSQRNILYPGSPITTSFHRGETSTGVIVIDTDTLEHVWVELDVPQLIRKTVNINDPKPQTPYHHTIYDVEGSIDDLAGLEDSSLVAKKVVKRTTDSALILDTEMSLSDEVREYLTYVLQVSPDTTAKVLLELQDNLSKIE